MYKRKIYTFLLTLLCLLTSSAVWADGDIPQNVKPTLTKPDEVCIFLESSTQATFNLWAWDGTYKPQSDRPAFPGDAFTLVGQLSDGQYLYKWTLPQGASGIPETIKICKNWTSTSENCIYDTKPFTNHGIYIDEITSRDISDLTATDITDATDKQIVKDNHTIYFLTPKQSSNYHVWAWGNDNGSGGSYYSTAGNYPGDAMTFVGMIGDNYLYKWVQTKNTDSTPTNFGINYGNDNKVAGKDGLTFNTNQYYVETITTEPTGGDHVYMQGIVRQEEETPQTDNLPSIAELNTADEVSAFVESNVKGAHYHIWPYNSEDFGGKNFTPDSIDYPGPQLEYVGTFKNKDGQDRYLYKWTEYSHINIIPLYFILSKGDGSDAKQFYSDKPFTNHGYYIVNEDGDNVTVNYSTEVSKLSDGSYATSRTTYGKRVIYELNFGEFSSAADGLKIKDATKRLSYLKDLGVDVIYVMPIYQRDKDASPYAATDLTQINSRYGTEQDMKDFVTQAHLMGMDVWLDFAPNHVGVNNIWLKKPEDGGTNYHPEYFSKGTDGNYVNPNGYNDVYQLDYQTLQQNSDGVYVNPAEEAVKQILLDWVDKLDIDGYRFDYVTSGTIPDGFWNDITVALKAKKSSLQFLAERDFSQGNTPDPSYFTYDYAWDFNTDLRKFGVNIGTYLAEFANDNSAPGCSGHLADITRERVDNFDHSIIAPMVYLTNHDMNWNDDDANFEKGKTPKSMNDAWGDNRFPMTVYEFTMPGMPLIYNGQEQNGTLKLDYFTEPSIDWDGTKDHNMYTLIQNLAHLKHVNNALNDGYSKDQRGDLYILNTYNHNVLAYERIKGDNHLLVVLNFSNNVETTQIAGATTGEWTKILQGNKDDYAMPDSKSTITDLWQCNNIPANGYQIWSYTGPKKQVVRTGLYFVADDSKNNDTKHVMSKQLDGSYQFMFEADEFDALNTKQGDVKPAEGDNTISFKLQEYYDWKGTICKTDRMLGAYDTKDAVFSSTNLSYKARKDGDVDQDDAGKKLTKNNNFFSMVKGAGLGETNNNILRYIFTFVPDSVLNSDGKTKSATMDHGTLTLKIVKKGDVTDGWYLETPENITGTDDEKLKWRFKTEGEDPDAVSDNYLRYKIKDEKTLLASYTIDHSLFDKYKPEDGRQNVDYIQFRIQRVDNGLFNVNKDGKVTQVSPANDIQEDSTLYTFDVAQDPNRWYKNSYWEPYDESDQRYFILHRNDNVDKYIIQIWRNSSYTSVKVYYVMNYDYTGSDIHDITASNEDVYLYNVDAHKFLYTGNTWGTMASLLYKDLGTRMNVSKGVTGENPDYKMIRTKFENNTTVPNGHMMGIDDFSYRAIANPKSDYDKFINLDSANVFLDRDNGNRWIIERVDTNDVTNTYILRLYDNKDNRFHMMLAAHDPVATSNINTHVIYIAQNVTTVDASDMPDREGTRNGVTFTGRDIRRNGRKTDRSNSTYIGYIGNGNKITYKYNAVKNGTYDITVSYLDGRQGGETEPRYLKVSVGSVDSLQQAPKRTTSWGDRGSAAEMSYSFHMNKGENTITIGDQDDDAPNIVSFSVKMTRPDDLTYARWQFVTYHDLMEKLRNENSDVYGSTNADATFLMKDQGFTRYIQNTWDTDNAKTGVYNITYTTKADRENNALDKTYSSSTSSVTCTKNIIGDDRINGMYWNGHIHGKGLVYQDIDVPVYGIYQFDAYGFWHGSTTKMFYQYATGFDANGNATGWSNMFVGHALKENPNGYNGTLKDSKGNDNSKQNDIATGEEIYRESVLGSSPQNWLNSQYTYIPENTPKYNGNYRLRIGFFKTAADVDHGDADKDYTSVDDIHLHYKGKAPFTLKDSWSLQELKDTSALENRQSVPVWLKRKFTEGIWNPVVLPLDVSVSTLQDLFGPNVLVERPYGLDPDNPMRIMFSNVDLTNVNGGIALEAGKYYLVKPEKNKVNGNMTVPILDPSTNTVLEEEIGSNDAAGTKFLYLGTYDLREGTTNKANLQADAPSGTLDDFHPISTNKKGNNSIEIRGNYGAITVTPTSDAEQKEHLYNYVFSGGKLVKLVKRNASLKGYRFYIHENFNPSGSAKEAVTSDKSWDIYSLLALYNKKGGTTGIEEVNTQTNDNSTSKFNDGYVYDLSGRRVAENGKIDELPRGVYIMNGKKFIKR